MPVTPYHAQIVDAGTRNGVDPALLEAVVLTESAGQADAFRYEPAFYDRYLASQPFFAAFCNPRRVSSSYGLCQIMYATAVQYGFTKQPEYLFVPDANLDLGAQILRDLLRVRHRNADEAIQAYNAGLGNIGSPAALAYLARVHANQARVVAATA